MKRQMTATLAGEEVTLAATFDASVEIMEKVADPLSIAREAAIEAQFLAAGQVYDARFKLTVKNVPQIIFAGMRAAGDKRDLKAVQQLVFDHGLIESRAIAMDYVALIVTPTSEEATEKGEGEPGE